MTTNDTELVEAVARAFIGDDGLPLREYHLTQARSAIAAARPIIEREVLEKAAKICERMSHEPSEYEEKPHEWTEGFQSGCYEASIVIRSRITEEGESRFLREYSSRMQG